MNTKNVLLWIAVIPASVLAGIIVTFPAHWIMYFTLKSFVDPYPGGLERMIMPGITSATAIYVSSLVAPTHKLKTAIVFGVIWIIFLLLIMFFLKIESYKITFEWSTVFAMIGVLIGIYLVKNKLNE
jgi:hypothetical protein